MADGDVRFLDALRVAGWDVEEQVHFAGERATGLAGESDEIRAAGASDLHGSDDVGARAAGGKRNDDVVFGNQGFYLASENLLEAEIVGGGGKHRRIRGKSECGQAWTSIA